MGQKKREIDLTPLAWAALGAIIRDIERQQDSEKQKEAAG